MKSVFRVTLDENSNRLIATHKFSKFLNDDFSSLHVNKRVTIVPYKKTPLGYKVIVDNRFEGLIYHNEIFQKVSLGDRLEAYVKNIRGDKKLDISLQPKGKSREKTANKKILEVLKDNKGTLSCNYKSSPKDIKELFGLSKKSYKKALTSLSNDKIILINKDGIELANYN